MFSTASMKLGLALLASVALTAAKYTTGEVDNAKDTMIFLDSFCFNLNKNISGVAKAGQLEYHVWEATSANATHPLRFATFVDENLKCNDTEGTGNFHLCDMWNWFDIWNKKISCEEMYIHSDGKRNVYNTTGDVVTYFGDWSRPHYWFLTVANCENISVSFKYSLNWTQPDGSAVSYDDRSLLGIDWSFFVFYLVVLGGTIFFNFVQHKEMGQQPLVRIYGLVLLLFWLAFFCDGIHWAVYPRNGYGVPFFSVLSTIILYFGRIVWIFLLILLAHGWSITRVALPDRKILFGILGALLLVFIILFFWQEFGVNSATLTSAYASVPGGLYLFVITAAGLYFGWTCWSTLKETVQADKKSFFIVFGGIYLAWFLSIPIVAAIVTSIDPWDRTSVQVGVETAITFIAHAILAALLHPSRASKYFITTTQDLLLDEGKNSAGRGDYGAL